MTLIKTGQQRANQWTQAQNGHLSTKYLRPKPNCSLLLLLLHSKFDEATGDKRTPVGGCFY